MIIRFYFILFYKKIKSIWKNTLVFKKIKNPRFLGRISLGYFLSISSHPKL